ncbi:methionine/alanine import family NSS transporter small subunit [Agromyces sp. H66]|uniref:methionine/alanine import family NSS transporter small subunit n=1 Tax=Agromyces sp. H66 TaxID=2529859 RepID=UPI0010AB2377|nr:methionine/alanine import family NSS transporter small subunit [Agromyces sp. H66]
MSPLAVVFLVLAMLLVWGGLVVSAVFLSRRPHADGLPPGGEDDHREDEAPVERDT